MRAGSMFTSMVSSTKGVTNTDAKRSHTLALGIVGRNTHQAVYTVLTFQVAVGIITGNLDGTSLDTCLVSFLPRLAMVALAVSLGIAQIHTHQHACPVLALRTTGTRVNFQHTVHLIGFLAKHILEFEGLDSSDCLGIGIVHFLFSHQFVL